MLLLFQFGLGGRADFDDGDAAGQFGLSLLELFAIEIGSGLGDLGFDLLDSGLDVSLSAFAFDDGGIIFVGGYPAGSAQVFYGDGIQLAADFFGNHLAAGQDSHIFEHGFSSVAEAGGFDGQDIQWCRAAC